MEISQGAWHGLSMAGDERAESPAETFARALVAIRTAAGLTRAQLAEAARIDRSVLSRLESGRYAHRLSTQSLERLSAALSCGDALYAAGGFPLPEVRELTGDARLGLAFADIPAARKALSRLHMTQVALSAVAPALTGEEPGVDVGRLWGAVRRQAGLDPAPAPASGPGSREGSVAGRRFLIAHGSAHILLQTTCHWPYGTDAEVEASELAGILLTPPGPLTQAVRAAFRSGIDPWDPDTGGLVAAVSDSLLIPGWLAAYRLADFNGLHLQLIPDDEENM
ncbi:helix-turn-helix transcriptional regulator [Streptomyces sp. NBC_00569]|uniref:helix-turn-helix domain-containing protein n=1 Tax=Streptomyces sp. NBC_00569 TaxID=2975780 RepID=UPI002E822170|nr:helix-turn-helix transcriptional regulator [Streptomyces sp. NBC_00569]WUB92409.1 helix-turn-helix transcriptional regulator [Streptomyces sp. NBC_00569]